MRKLMWFTIGFTAACVIGVYFLSGLWLGLIGLFCLVAFLPMLFIGTKPAKIVAAVLLGCIVGFTWLWGYDGFYLSSPRSVDGETLPLAVTASDYSYAINYGHAFVGSI